MVKIQKEESISLEEFVFILSDSGLGKRRPMDDPDQLQRMISGSNLLVTARIDGQLVGLLRALSDFCFRCFVSDLAVAQAFQGRGIGRGLLKFTRDLAPKSRVFLFSAEDSEPFYQKLGFKTHERCYQLKPGQQLF
jgi:GNAT superfamily N-acetyltransferase